MVRATPGPGQVVLELTRKELCWTGCRVRNATAEQEQKTTERSTHKGDCMLFKMHKVLVTLVGVVSFYESMRLSEYMEPQQPWTLGNNRIYIYLKKTKQT